MSEQISLDALAKSNDEVEDDPLAELARIVAGEPEPETELPQPDLTIDQTAVAPEQLDVVANFGNAQNELEAALEAEFVNSEVEPLPQPEITNEVSFDSFEAELEQAIASPESEHLEKVSQHENAVEVAQSETTASVQSEVDNTDRFQDDLILALQQEIEPAVVEVQPDNDVQTVEELLETGFEASGDFQEIPTQVPEASTQFDAAEHYDVPQEEQVQPPEAEAFVEAEAPEVAEELQEFADIAHVSKQNDLSSADEDLGAAFANEFEQMLAETPQPAAVQEKAPFADSQPDFADTGTQETVYGEEQNGAPELDFSSAFAQELGVDHVTEAQGWAADETASANAVFAEAAQQPAGFDNVQVPELQSDPGHIGAISEVGDSEQTFAATAKADDGPGSKKYAVAALVIALFAGTIAAGYGFLGGGTSSTSTGEPKLILADADPFKTKPDDPGGRIPANQDNASYGKVAGEDTDQVEQPRLISETEQPTNITTEELQIVEEPETNLASKSDERLTATNQSQPEETNASGNVAPRVVQTVVVKPDGTIVTQPSIPAIPQASETVSNTVNVAANTVSQSGESLTNGVVAALPKPVETITIKPETAATKPDSVDGASSTGSIAIPEASPLPKPEPVVTASAASQPTAEPAPSTPAVRKSEWVVQVSSQRSPEAAQASFQNLRNRFSVLQGRAMSIQRATVNDATFYRVRVQTASRSDANQLCSSLQSAGGSCFVTR